MIRTALLCALALPATADEFGTTNPVEMGHSRVLQDMAEGRTSMAGCAAGYLMTKSGRHDEARAIFEPCAADGYSQAMTWMSYMEQNGFGGRGFDPDAAAEWDRRAAEAGDPNGMFNYGVDLMRGFGVARDEAAGRALIDRAAEAGSEFAQRLRAADYDLDVITPDADDWRYAPVM